MSQSSSPQDLDLSMLQEIADGSDEFIVESIAMFLQHTPEMLNAILTATAAGDWPNVAATAHKLKPNLGFFGMPVCQAIIQEVELMAKEGAPDPDMLKRKFDEAKTIIDGNITELKRIKAEIEG